MCKFKEDKQYTNDTALKSPFWLRLKKNWESIILAQLTHGLSTQLSWPSIEAIHHLDHYHSLLPTYMPANTASTLKAISVLDSRK